MGDEREPTVEEVADEIGAPDHTVKVAPQAIKRSTLPPATEPLPLPPAPTVPEGGEPVTSARSIHTAATLTTARPKRPSAPPVEHAVTDSRPRLPGGDLERSRNSATTTSADALHVDEINRMRLFLAVIMATTLAAVLAIALTPGDPMAAKVVYAGSALVFVGAGLFRWELRDPGRYTTNRIIAYAAVIATGAFAGVYYWGIASPATTIFIYGIYVFSMGGHMRVVLGMYLWCALLHLLLSAAILTGLTEDRGIVDITAYEPMIQISMVAMVQALYFVAFVTARAARRVTLQAVTRFEQAVRQVAQREAMLAEVRGELDRALKVGGPGRYTEQRVGSFRIGNLLGRGGMGEVYEATSVVDDKPAAVKLLHPATLADPQQVQRFIREAEVVASIQSPHVVGVLEVGTTTGEIPFIAMEKLRGDDLAHHLRKHRTIPLAQAVELVHQIAIGLDAARRQGVVHRDLKPHNLFLADVGGGLQIWKILDFGVAKHALNHGTLTQGHVIGTPGYMAPEQARGENVDHRADVYALAAIVYRCVTGQPAFAGKDVPSTLYDAVYKMPTQPSQLAQVPADVDRVIALGMAKLAEERVQTASELAAWMRAAVRSELPPEARRRADLLIEKWPWGTRL